MKQVTSKTIFRMPMIFDHFEIRDRPGLGIDVNEDVVAKSQYVYWQRTAPIRPDGATGYI